MSSFQTFDHAYRKAIKVEHTRNSAVKYAAKKYVYYLLDSYDLKYVSEDTESDLTEDFVEDYIEQRDKGRSHETAFVSASAHLKDVIETLEKKGRRRGKENARPALFSQNMDDILEGVKRGFEDMHVHRHDSAHHYSRLRPERVHTTPLPRRYVLQNSHAPPMPSTRGRYAFPDPVYAVPRAEAFSGKEYFPAMSGPEGVSFRSGSPSHHHRRRPTAGTHAYTTQEFRPSVSGRRKDTHRHEYDASRDERQRYTTYDPQPRYEPSPPPRENPRRYNTYQPCPPRPLYNNCDPSSPPPHSRTHYSTPPSPTCSPNLYAVLDVSPTATQAEIKSAYRKSSLKHHPDRCADKDAATARMAEINTANDVLSDEGKRRVYDVTGRIDV